MNGFHRVTAGGVSTASQTSLGGKGEEVHLCLIEQPRATVGQPGLKIAMCLLIGAIHDDSVILSKHPPAVNAVEMPKLVFFGVSSQYANQLLGTFIRSKALQDWGFHSPGKSEKSHNQGMRCWSECRDCKISCLVGSPIGKQSFHHLCWSTP